MAWNTGTSYVSASALTAAILNGIGTDLRTWGGNVDGGGYNLVNVAELHATAKLGVGIASPTAVGHLYQAASSGYILKFESASPAKIYGLGLSVEASNLLLDNISAGTRLLTILAGGGFVGIGTVTPTSPLHVVGIPVYANNAAAVSGGLTAGAFYRTGANPDPICIVH